MYTYIHTHKHTIKTQRKYTLVILPIYLRIVSFLCIPCNRLFTLSNSFLLSLRKHWSSELSLSSLSFPYLTNLSKIPFTGFWHTTRSSRSSDPVLRSWHLPSCRRKLVKKKYFTRQRGEEDTLVGRFSGLRQPCTHEGGMFEENRSPLYRDN